MRTIEPTVWARRSSSKSDRTDFYRLRPTRKPSVIVDTYDRARNTLERGATSVRRWVWEGDPGPTSRVRGQLPCVDVWTVPDVAAATAALELVVVPRVVAVEAEELDVRVLAVVAVVAVALVVVD